MAEENTQPTGTPAAGNPEDNGGKSGEQTPKTFTAEEHQAELDRVAAKTRNEEKIKREADVAAAKEQARKEALEEASMSEKERQEKMNQKKAQEDAEREKNLTIRENKLDAVKKFIELQLPSDDAIVDLFVNTDKEKMLGAIETFAKVFNAAVAEGVKTQLAGGKPPKDPNSGKPSTEKQQENYF